MAIWLIGISAFLSSIGGLYLLIQWRYLEAKERIPAVFDWALGLIFWGIALGIEGLTLLPKFEYPSLNFKIAFPFFYVFLTAGLILIFRGVIRFFSKEEERIHLISLLIFLILNGGTIYGFLYFRDTLQWVLVYDNLFFIPVLLILGVLFLLLYSKFSMLINGKVNIGTLLVGLSFFLFAVKEGIFYFIQIPPEKTHWYFWRIIIQLLLIIGFIMFERRLHEFRDRKVTMKRILEILPK